MQSATIICDARRGDGAPCGELALVHSIQYLYAAEPVDESPDSAHVLREARYTIDCPRCGRRTQVVVF
ncbi:MAG: hypothetical protein IT424_00430 [Pirellulales bacterium]|nr:hypothetical protein [Pirellulales bacterium]